MLAGVLACSLSANAQHIDFNIPGRQASQVTEKGYLPWAFNASVPFLKTSNGITVTINGKDVKASWWKDGVNRYSKLTGDGIFSVSGDITVTLKGMPAGKHTLLAYHNNTDGTEGGNIDVSVNGKPVVKNIASSNRAKDTEHSAYSYITFQSDGKKDIVISYKGKNFFINGLVFDEEDPADMASYPYPADFDFHAIADDGNMILKWKAADKATKHRIYIGTKPEELSLFKETTDSEIKLEKLSNLNTYYWRVDEINKDGRTVKGKEWQFRTRHLAFPGAEGYGRYAIGGRGGAVYHVTSLADYKHGEKPIPGTLRYGIEEVKVPRTIVFDAGGVIALKDRLGVSDPYVTIAGQTAPGQGVMLRDSPFGMQTEGITRFIRVRLGHKEKINGKISKKDNASGLDGMGMAGNNNSIMDHCSISWTIDEAFSSRNAKGITLQHTLISEALNQAGHPNYPAGNAHGYAATIGGGENSNTIGSFHHNLLANCEGRNWSISGGLDGAGNYDGHHDIFNNVVYNWGHRGCDGGSHEINFFNNYYKKGPATTQNFIFRLQLEGTGSGTQSAYVAGNIIQEPENGTKNSDILNTNYRYELSHGQKLTWQPFTSTPFWTNHEAHVETAGAAFRNVLSDVGANQPFMDNHDLRMIHETLTGTTSTIGSIGGKKGIIDSEEDNGCEGFEGLNITTVYRETNFDTDQNGMPDWWEKATGMTDGNADDNKDGYTNLEEYLNWMANPHFEIESDRKIKINLADYFAGYHHGTYSVSNSKDIKVKPSKKGIYTFRNISEKDKVVSISVTCSEGGDSLTRIFNFHLK